jgi:phosphoglycolate phosphatase
MPPNLNFKAVIFDLDGTLLDTLAEIADSMNGALDRLGFPVHDLSAYRYLTGDGVLALITNSLPYEARDEGTIRLAGEILREEYLGRWAKKAKLYEGIPELLEALTRRGVSLNILSNKMDEFTQKAAGQFLGRWTFDHVLGDSPRFRRKPDPAAALHIAAELNLTPAAIVYLGDTRTDMTTAVAAGMFPVGALWGFRDKDELLASGARAVIAHPLELLFYF